MSVHVVSTVSRCSLVIAPALCSEPVSNMSAKRQRKNPEDEATGLRSGQATALRSGRGRLPTDVWQLTLSNLTLQELLEARLVCKLWKRATSDRMMARAALHFAIYMPFSTKDRAQ
jgi:hypothetical protein